MFRGFILEVLICWIFRLPDKEIALWNFVLSKISLPDATAKENGERLGNTFLKWFVICFMVDMYEPITDLALPENEYNVEEITREDRADVNVVSTPNRLELLGLPAELRVMDLSPSTCLSLGLWG